MPIGTRAFQAPRTSTRTWSAAAVAVLAVATTVGCGGDRYGAPRPATEQGQEVVDLWRILFLTGAAIGVLVTGLILWSIVRYRRRGDGDREPPQFRDNVRLELFYTAVPFVIVAVLFGISLRTSSTVTRVSSTPDVRVDVTGFRWGWRFDYPEAHVSVVGDSNQPPLLVLPVDRTIQLTMTSADVVHAFFVPAFLGKKDLVPGIDNRIDLTTSRTGRFGGLCAEYCGLDHGRMTFSVDVVPPADFEAWLASQPRTDDGAVEESPPTSEAEGAPPGRQATDSPPSSREES